MLAYCFTESVFVCVCGGGLGVSCMICSGGVRGGVRGARACMYTVLWDAAGSCAWSGDVMMSCGFLLSLLLSLCLVYLLATIYDIYYFY